MADPSLAETIRRIILAPYPVTLKTLDTALRTVGSRGVKAWAASHPCQIEAIAIAIVHALEFCPYAIPVIEQMGFIPAIRNEMLKEKPALISEFVERSLKSEAYNMKYAPALLALLSSPLPEEFPHPVSVIPYFIQRVRAATENTTLENMRPLYIMASNGYGYIGELMSPDRRRQLSKQINRLIKKVAGQLELTAMALATLAHLAMAPGNADAEGGDDVVEMFSGKKGPTLLGLITNIVISWIDDEKMKDEEAAENIAMVIPIANVASNNTNPELQKTLLDTGVKRLLEKCAGKEMQLDVLNEVLKYVTAIRNVAPLPQVQEVFDRAVGQSVKEGWTGRFLPADMGKLFTTTSDAAIRDVLLWILRLATSSPEPILDHYTSITRCNGFLCNLITCIPESPEFRKRVLSLLREKEFELLMNDFLVETHLCATPRACYDTEACHLSVISRVKDLHMTLSQLILQIGAYSAQADATLEPKLACALMDKNMRLSALILRCEPKKYAKSHKTHSLLPILEAAATPETRMSSRSWRYDIVEGLARAADHSQNFIVASVSEIVRDLEHRCENVEEPLRAEQEVNAKLREQLQELQVKCEKLREDMLAKDTEIVKATRLAQEHECNTNIESAKRGELEKKVKELQNLMVDLKEEARQAQKEYEQQLEKVRIGHREHVIQLKDEADAAAMEHMEALNNRQDQIDELETELQKTNAHVDELLADQNKQREQIIDLESLKNTLETEHAELHSTIETLQAERDDLAAQGDILETENLKMQNEVESLKSDLDTLAVERTTLNTELSFVKKELAISKEKLEARIGQLELAEKTIGEQEATIEQLQRDITAMQSAFEEKTEEYQNDLELAKSERLRRIETLQKDFDETIGQLKVEHEAEQKKLTAAMEKLTAEHKVKLEETAIIHAKQLDALNTTIADLKEANAAEAAEARKLEKKVATMQKEQVRRERDAQRLARQLMGIHQPVSDDSSPEPTPRKRKADPDQTPTQASRRRTRATKDDVENTPLPKRSAKSTKTVRASPKSTTRKALATKENRQPPARTPSQPERGRESNVEDSVRETQMSQESVVREEWDESTDDYGSGIVLTMTPRELREAEDKFIDGFDETTMDF